MSALDVPLSLRLPKKTAKALEGAGVATVGDLLMVAPRRYYHLERKGNICCAKRSRMGDIYHCGRSRAERGRLPWLCLKPLPSLPAPRLSSCGGKRRDRSSKTSF